MPPRKLKDEFGPGATADVLAACQAAVTRASRAFSRAFDARCQLAVGKASTLSQSSLDDHANGPGLVILLPVGQRAALVIVDQSAGVLPEWHDRPNATQAGRLSALAQELGKALLPRRFAAKDCAISAVRDLGAALRRGGCTRDAALVQFTLSINDGPSGKLWLVWPIDNPALVFDPAPTGGSCTTERGAGEASEQVAVAKYQRGLLRVKVSLAVTLAAARQPVERVAQISPGAILRFDKSHAELLDLEVDGRRIAQGQCIEVGRRLGLLVTSLSGPLPRAATGADVRRSAPDNLSEFRVL